MGDYPQKSSLSCLCRDHAVSLGYNTSLPSLCTSGFYPPFRAPVPGDCPPILGSLLGSLLPQQLPFSFFFFTPSANPKSFLYIWKMNQEAQCCIWVWCPPLPANRACMSLHHQNACSSVLELPVYPLVSPLESNFLGKGLDGLVQAISPVPSIVTFITLNELGLQGSILLLCSECLHSSQIYVETLIPSVIVFGDGDFGK